MSIKNIIFFFASCLFSSLLQTTFAYGDQDINELISGNYSHKNISVKQSKDHKKSLYKTMKNAWNNKVVKNECIRKNLTKAALVTMLVVMVGCIAVKAYYDPTSFDPIISWILSYRKSTVTDKNKNERLDQSDTDNNLNSSNLDVVTAPDGNLKNQHNKESIHTAGKPQVKSRWNALKLSILKRLC